MCPKIIMTIYNLALEFYVLIVHSIVVLQSQPFEDWFNYL